MIRGGWANDQSPPSHIHSHSHALSFVPVIFLFFASLFHLVCPDSLIIPLAATEFWIWLLFKKFGVCQADFWNLSFKEWEVFFSAAMLRKDENKNKNTKFWSRLKSKHEHKLFSECCRKQNQWNLRIEFDQKLHKIRTFFSSFRCEMRVKTFRVFLLKYWMLVACKTWTSEICTQFLFLLFAHQIIRVGAIIRGGLITMIMSNDHLWLFIYHKYP